MIRTKIKFQNILDKGTSVKKNAFFFSSLILVYNFLFDLLEIIEKIVQKRKIDKYIKNNI